MSDDTEPDDYESERPESESDWRESPESERDRHESSESESSEPEPYGTDRRSEGQPPPPEWGADRSGVEATADGHPGGRRGRTDSDRSEQPPGGERGWDPKHGRERPQGPEEHPGERGRQSPGPEGRQSPAHDDSRNRGGSAADQSATSGRQEGGPPPGATGGRQASASADRGGEGTQSLGRKIGWVIVAFAVAGVALGLLPFTYGTVGEEAFVQAEQQDQELTEEEREQQQVQFKNELINFLVIFGPYLAVVFGLGSGMAIGLAGSDPPGDAARIAGAGTAVGIVLFLLLGTAIAAGQWETVEEGGFLGQERTLQYGTLLINAVAIAVPTALGAAVASYAGSRLRS